MNNFSDNHCGVILRYIKQEYNLILHSNMVFMNLYIFYAFDQFYSYGFMTSICCLNELSVLKN